MRILHKSNPLGARQILNVHLAIGGSGDVGASKDIGACVGWLVQHPQHIMMLELSPGELSLMGATADPPWKEQMLLTKMANRCASRSGLLKAAKDGTNSRLDLQVRIQDNGIRLSVTQSNGQGEFESSTPRFVQDTSEACVLAGQKVQLPTWFPSTRAKVCR